MALPDIIVEAQKVVSDLQALPPLPPADPIVSITVTTQSGATQTFVPQS